MIDKVVYLRRGIPNRIVLRHSYARANVFFFCDCFLHVISESQFPVIFFVRRTITMEVNFLLLSKNLFFFHCKIALFAHVAKNDDLKKSGDVVNNVASKKYNNFNFTIEVYVV